jgi:cold shock CspA family protein
MGTNTVVQGEVIRFDPVRGYGFIAPRDGGEDVFLHANDLLDEKHLIRPGATVEFVLETGDRGLKASSVHLVSPAPALRPPSLTPATTIPGAAVSHPDDDFVDVLLEADFQREVTELLLRADPGLTSGQILAIRSSLADLARRRGWISDS